MSLDGVYVPTERAPAPGGPSEPPSEPGERSVPTLFLPTLRVRPEDAEFQVELRHLVDGRLALLTYSSLESLVVCCGEAQPWVEVPAARVDEVATTAAAETVVLDQPLDSDQRHRPESAS